MLNPAKGFKVLRLDVTSGECFSGSRQCNLPEDPEVLHFFVKLNAVVVETSLERHACAYPNCLDIWI